MTSSDPLDNPEFLERVQGIRQCLYTHRHSPPETQLVRLRVLFKKLEREMGWVPLLHERDSAYFAHPLLPRLLPLMIIEDLGGAYRVRMDDTGVEKVIPKRFIRG